MKAKHILSDSVAVHTRMTTAPIPGLIAGMALPTVASQLISVIYNTADTYFVAHIGTSAAAAVGVVFSVMALIQAVGFGLGMGAGSLISRLLGEKKDDEASRIGSSAFGTALLFGTLLMVAGLTTLPGLMRLLGATPTMLPYACDYAGYILAGAPIMCSSFVLSNILRAEGAAVFSMVGLCSGGILNLLLDPFLIFTCHMGVGGAALATVISQVVSFGVLLVTFVRRKSIVRLSIHRISRQSTDYLQIVRSGLPSICRQGLASVASACLNIQGAAFGDAVVAAVTISNKLYMLVRSLVIGIGQGFQPVAGYNYGAGHPKRVRSAFWFSCLLGTGVCTVAAGLLAWQAEGIIGLFRSDPAVLQVGKTALCLGSAVMPALAYSTFVNQLYQCLGYSGQATFLASCRQGIFFLPLVFLLPHLLGVTGLVMVQPAADLSTFLISVPFQIAFFRKHLNTSGHHA